MKSLWIWAIAAFTVAGLAFAETKTGQEASATVNGKTISVKYSSPAVNGRVGKLFGKDGSIGKDDTYPVWRGGANAATAFHTDSDLDLGGLKVPKGDYTLYVNLTNPAAWELIVNKQTGQGGTEYHADRDLGRVKMIMAKTPALVEQLNYSLSVNGSKGKLALTWENVTASVNFTAK